MALHPQAQKFLDDLAALNPPAWHDMSPDEGRKAFAGLTDLFGEGEPVQEVTDKRAGDVPVRVYTPAGTAPFPVIVYFHGGGWVLGDLATHDPLCRRLANRSQCVVVSVDYRRSPECKFPGPLEDSFAAVGHIAKNAEEFQADARRIAVAGDSAGGNLAAAVALRARDESGPPLSLQLLIYPITDYNFDTASYTECADGFALTRRSMQWFWEQYVSHDADGKNPYASPLLALDLRGLPPAHVITAQYDVLRDEGQAYAQRLSDAGVPTTTRHYEDMIHGFMHFMGVFDTGKEAVDDAAALVRERLK